MQAVEIKKAGQDVLHQLEDFNKKMWDAVSFSLIEAPLNSQENSKRTKEHRTERWQRAIQRAKGDKVKAYQLLSSEEFI
jgi:hypothetical protein